MDCIDVSRVLMKGVLTSMTMLITVAAAAACADPEVKSCGPGSTVKFLQKLSGKRSKLSRCGL